MRRSSRNLRPPTLVPPTAPESSRVQQDAGPASRKRPTDKAAQNGDETLATGGPLADAPKRRKVARGRKKDAPALYQSLFGPGSPRPESGCCSLPPTRVHAVAYHRPLLLDRREGRAALLAWFDDVSTARSMPWRKPWIDQRRHHNNNKNDDAEAGEPLRAQLERRAYEVWISEIMLQQTRVAVVVDYWKRWMARWPTIRDLAAASADDVLAAWRGLGYYSRATRIHEAARTVVADGGLRGLLPAAADELAARVPGVGPYTAGAISAIVFGRAAPMVDGNVLRVLSRQLGLLADVKADRANVELLWAAADGLVKAVAGDAEEEEDDEEEEEALDDPEGQVSDRPGRWGQALMELGSTVCSPKPNCAACPISSSCRAYGEGLQLAAKARLVPEAMAPTVPSTIPDIEDLCTICSPFDEILQDDESPEGVVVPPPPANIPTSPEKKKSRPQRQATLAGFFSQSACGDRTLEKSHDASSAKLSAAAVDYITHHAKRFPLRTIKKAVREEETLVCAIRRSDGKYLIHRRPPKGLLAGLWELPSLLLPGGGEHSAEARRCDAQRHASQLVGGGGIAKAKGGGKRRPQQPKHVRELGSVPWTFSHLKLTMHVHLFELEVAGEPPADEEEEAAGGRARNSSRWSDAVDDESMGTGMRKCWALVKEASDR
ncbi:DNA glycosylase [Xylariaceae sp. FL0804]|nr:DNA glycosylase [Xylariaceae sp. FL0804]